MELISSDTNIWIDFMAIHKLDLPFRLSYSYLMNTDAVEDELLSPQGIKEKLLEYGLIPTELTEEEFYYGMAISEIHPKLSQYDCAALAIAKMRNIVLMSGDAALRKVALSEGVAVTGTIGILDKLLETECVSPDEYKACILALLNANGREVRLPEAELAKRL